MSKSRNHKWNDDFGDEEIENTKAFRMSQRRNAKQSKYRQRDELLSNNDVKVEGDGI